MADALHTPYDWRNTASREQLLALIDHERAISASMARTMTAALDQLAANRALLVRVARHESTRGHALYGALITAAHDSLPHVVGRRCGAAMTGGVHG